MNVKTNGTRAGKLGHGIRVASFFSGAGGLDLGFHEAGFEIVFSSDIDSISCETLRRNKGKWVAPSTEIIDGDIRVLRSSEVPAHVDFVIGGPPCQSYSASGRRAGGAAGRLDPRGTLFEAYCRLLRRINPVGFLFENVRGIFGTNGGKDWKEIVKTFKALGYELSYRVLDACDYGIPQHRERIILVGHRLNHDFLFPEPVCGPDSNSAEHYISPNKAFQGILESEDLGSLTLDNGKYSYLLPLVPPGGNYLFFTAKRGFPKPIFAYRSRFSDFLYKAHPDYPIKTLIASPGKYTGPFHWDNRRFSVSEYKRLQGFPDGYEFSGTRSDVIRQIGNSVSPRQAKYLALAIARQLFQREETKVRLMPTAKVLSFDRRKGMTAQGTREKHRKIALNRKNGTHIFEIRSYSTRVEPFPIDRQNVLVETKGKHVRMKVQGDISRSLFARVVIEVTQYEPDLFTTRSDAADAQLEIKLYGSGPNCIQTMWNAVDDWVIRSSNFHSLYELYGHFTEPHPIFSIKEFTTFSKHPIAQFALHIGRFENCSRYFPRRHLTRMFGGAFGTTNFPELARILRSYRFDIRCHETNVAISPDLYMVAYPFTLPNRRQMNFSVKDSAMRQAQQ